VDPVDGDEVLGPAQEEDGAVEALVQERQTHEFHQRPAPRTRQRGVDGHQGHLALRGERRCGSTAAAATTPFQHDERSPPQRWNPSQRLAGLRGRSGVTPGEIRPGGDEPGGAWPAQRGDPTQEMSDRVGERQAAGEPGLTFVRRAHRLQEPGREQRRLRGECGARRGHLGGIPREQPQREIAGRELARHVVIQVRADRGVPPVELRRETEEDDVALERSERELPDEVSPAWRAAERVVRRGGKALRCLEEGGGPLVRGGARR
jgi:hypothetical protein